MECRSSSSSARPYQAQQGPFIYSDDGFQVRVGRSPHYYISRLTGKALYDLINSDNPLNVPSGDPAAFYAAQCMHYGLPALFDRHLATSMLRDSFKVKNGEGILNVPPPLVKIKKVLKSEYERVHGKKVSKGKLEKLSQHKAPKAGIGRKEKHGATIDISSTQPSLKLQHVTSIDESTKKEEQSQVDLVRKRQAQADPLEQSQSTVKRHKSDPTKRRRLLRDFPYDIDDEASDDLDSEEEETSDGSSDMSEQAVGKFKGIGGSVLTSRTPMKAANAGHAVDSSKALIKQSTPQSQSAESFFTPLKMTTKLTAGPHACDMRDALIRRLWGRWNIKIPTSSTSKAQKDYSLVLGKITNASSTENVMRQDESRGIAFFVGELTYSGRSYLLLCQGCKKTATVIGTSLKLTLNWVQSQAVASLHANAPRSGSLTLFFNGLDIDIYVQSFPEGSAESTSFEARYVRKLTLSDMKHLMTWRRDFFAVQAQIA